MKQLYTLLITLVLLVLTITNSSAQVTYLKTIDLHALNFGQALTRTRDKGYVMVGQDKQFIHAISSFCYSYLAKIDSCGNLASTQLYNYAGQPRVEGYGLKSVIEANAINKYIIVGTVNRLQPDNSLLKEMLVMQVDITGGIDWLSTHASAAGEAQGVHVTETSNGYVACGYVDEDASTQKTPYITKVDKATGAFMWEKAFTSLIGTYSYGNYVQEFANGDILFLGSYGNGANNDFFAMRLSATGNVIWSNKYDVGQFDGQDWDVSGKITSDGAFLLSGSTKQGTNYNTVLIKADATTGTVLHTATFDNAGQDDRGRTVTELATGDYVQMGNTQTGATSHTIMNKVDKNFNYKWSRTMTLNNYSKSWGVNEETDKGIVFSGLTTADFTNYTALLVKTDSLGSLSATCNLTATPIVTYNAPFVTAQAITTTLSANSYFKNDVPVTNFSPSVGAGTMATVCFECTPIVHVSKPAICPLDTFYVVTTAIPCSPHTLVVSEVSTGITTAPFKTNGDTLFYILSASGNYNITRNTNCNGTPNIIVKNIVVHPTPVATITSTPSICQGDKDTLFATVTVGTAPYTYVWGGANVPTINNNTVPLNTNLTINATLQVKDTYGCKSAVATYLLENNPLPQPSFTVVPVCLNEASVFTNTTSGSHTVTNTDWKYTDKFGAAVGSNNVANPTFIFATCNENYAIKLIATTDKGCKDSVVQLTHAYCLPIPNFTFVNGCEKDDVINFINTSTNGAGTSGAMNSLWYLDINNPTETNTNPSKIYNSAGAYPITLKITDVYGCVKDTLKTLKVYPKPNANFTVASVCYKLPSIFINTTTLNVPTAGGFTDIVDGYKWDYNYNGVAFTLNDISKNGTFTYPLTATETKPLVTLITKTNNNCKDTVTQPVIVWPLPQVLYSTIAPCYPNPLTFTNSTTLSAGTDNSSIATMVEYWGDTKTDIIPQLNSAIKHNYATSGNYQTMLVATSNYDCTDSLKLPAVVHAKPKALFNIAPPEGCEPLCVTFTNKSSQLKSPTVEFINKYEWTLGDYNDANGNTPITKDAAHCYQNPSDTVQKHTINLIITTDQGCKDTLLKPLAVTVYPLPVANFTASPTVTDMLNSQIYIADQSHLANVIEWSYGDGHTKSLRNATPLTSTTPYMYTYKDSGIYTVNQLVSTDYGCTDTAAITITIKPMYTIYIPNSFTPNNDGINDYFKPTGINIKDIDLLIFDRWGNVIARVQGIDSKGWDGTDYRTGEKCKTEVYNWKLMYVDVFNEKHTDWIGTVTLIK